MKSSTPESIWRFLKELEILAQEEKFALKSLNIEYLENLQPLKAELMTSLVNASNSSGINQSNNAEFKANIMSLIDMLEDNLRAIDLFAKKNETDLKEKKMSLKMLSQFKGSYQGNKEKGDRLSLSAQTNLFYNCLMHDSLVLENSPILKLASTTLVPFRYEDIFSVKDWRNAQMNVLRQKYLLTDTDQEEYYLNSILPSFSMKNPKQLLYSYLINDECIGYGGLVNLSWEDARAEVSFLLNPTCKEYSQLFSDFLTLIKQLSFKHLKLNKIFTETFDIRPQHVSVLEENGFKLEGRLKKHTLIDGEYVDSLIHGCLKND